MSLQLYRKISNKARQEAIKLGILLAVIYFAFISLGLPDSLLGSAWPNMYREFQVPLSYAGVISTIIACGTVFSSLQSDRLTRKFGTGPITAFSVALTAFALFGFSISHSFAALCVWAIPYGLGAGCVDASLNNYVAIHFESKHMSWLHCMWGIGASFGPYIMGAVLTGGASWNSGYRIVSILQIVLTALILCSLPRWKKDSASSSEESQNTKVHSLRELLRIPGVKQTLVCFFCYSAVEQTTAFWAASYLNLAKGVSAELAASFAGMFCIGITIGRGINGFIAIKLKDGQMIRMGQGIILIGILIMLLPLGKIIALLAFAMIGLGCAPVYPCIIHATPERFGAENSQAVIGLQMFCSFMGGMMQPLFGILTNHITIRILPLYLLFFHLIMVFMHEALMQRTGEKS